MHGHLVPVAFDWSKVIVVRIGAAMLTHRDDGLCGLLGMDRASMRDSTNGRTSLR
jgi:hypothetical protein